jgi:hypothetical protein
MTAFYSDKMTSPNVAQPKQTNSVDSVVAKATIPSGFATNDTIEMCKLPAGCVVTNARLCSNASVAGTASLGVGIAGTAEKYIANASHASSATTTIKAAAVGTVVSAVETVIVTAASIVTPVPGTILTLVIDYTSNP